MLIFYFIFAVMMLALNDKDVGSVYMYFTGLVFPSCEIFFKSYICLTLIRKNIFFSRKIEPNTHDISDCASFTLILSLIIIIAGIKNQKKIFPRF
jgi:hypothetical protein